jgi:hypothetical protein
MICIFTVTHTMIFRNLTFTVFLINSQCKWHQRDL